MKSYLRIANFPTSKVIETLNDLKAQDVSMLDVRTQSTFTDYMVISTGTSRRHVNAIVDAVVLNAKHQGTRVLGIEGQKAAEWVLIDLGDVVVHVMQRDARDFYDLERLWGIGVKQQEAI
ncbi:MAG: ribosome silencing factor [Gammaproteobacteria bacterium]|nr:ribosome silencing factor [Gammaproteobacteria bacterium]